MKTITDDRLIERRRRLATYASLGGIAVLGVGMWFSLRQEYIWVSMLALVGGILLATYGTNNMRIWGRSPRPDQIIESSMKGFDDRYRFYSWTLPAPYVILSPNGVYSLVTSDQTGDVSVNGSTWCAKLTLSRILLFFGQGSLGNPTRDALERAERLRQWIAANLPDVAVEVKPAIMFIDKRANLTIEEPTVPVLEAEELKKWLRGPGKGGSLKSVDYKALQALFDTKSAGAQTT